MRQSFRWRCGGEVHVALATTARALAFAVASSAVVPASQEAALPVVRRDGQKGGNGCFGFGYLTYEHCCVLRSHDDSLCWDNFYTPELCCTPEGLGCFVGDVTQELCCPPNAKANCWDDHFTVERCCPAPQSSASAVAPKPVKGGGRSECWIGSLTYEGCCLPTPNPVCFYDPTQSHSYFTAEFCCSTPTVTRTPLQAIREELFTGVDPYKILDALPYPPESHYPDSHLTGDIVRHILELVGDVSLWLEIGSFIGSSAITTASTIKKMGLSTGIVCIDPFTGVAEMWATRKAMRAAHHMADSALKMDVFGHSRIFETFLANVRQAGHADIVQPIRITSISGMTLFQMLKNVKRIEVLPQVIYLDSAHEEGETLLEVRRAWEILAAPGMLFGDDWSWPGVRNDVKEFAASLQLEELSPEALRRFDVPPREATQPVPGLVLLPGGDGTWLLPKNS
eukprot:TRINITY_DN73526_c0_g1_i1.p1 TRINITY_DN73526_c0_g1~~TRINITY_DN73526_c0_g1_i1.p1  ORF type:complete len:453 (-),score=88.03 TRINITY_DN73526_c0_g1_i1:82-1440(-)